MTTQDTGLIATKQNDGLNIFSTKDINIYNRDSLKVFADDNISLGTNRNVNIFSKNDSINLYGRTKVNFSTVTNTPLDNAMTINFGNTQSWAAAGLRINHFNNSNNTSFGIYINNSGSNTSGAVVGLGSYSYFNSNAQKRGIESAVSGMGTNIAMFLQSDTGSIVTDGYKNWSLYSDKGHIMIRDGHIISSSITDCIPSINTSGIGLSAYLISSATDTKGYINYSIGVSSSGIINIWFGRPYSQKPVVVITNTGDANVKLTSVSQYGFTMTISNSTTFMINGDINYMVME